MRQSTKYNASPNQAPLHFVMLNDTKFQKVEITKPKKLLHVPEQKKNLFFKKAALQ